MYNIYDKTYSLSADNGIVTYQLRCICVIQCYFTPSVMGRSLYVIQDQTIDSHVMMAVHSKELM